MPAGSRKRIIIVTTLLLTSLALLLAGQTATARAGTSAPVSAPAGAANRLPLRLSLP